MISEPVLPHETLALSGLCRKSPRSHGACAGRGRARARVGVGHGSGSAGHWRGQGSGTGSAGAFRARRAQPDGVPAGWLLGIPAPTLGVSGQPEVRREPHARWPPDSAGGLLRLSPLRRRPRPSGSAGDRPSRRPALRRRPRPPATRAARSCRKSPTSHGTGSPPATAPGRRPRPPATAPGRDARRTPHAARRPPLAGASRAGWQAAPPATGRTAQTGCHAAAARARDRWLESGHGLHCARQAGA